MKFAILTLALFLVLMISDVAAVHTIELLGTRSKDIIYVPLTWCAINGSQAVTHPNIPIPEGGDDTTTDAVLSRRHERVTNYVWIDQAGIAFRSAISNTSNSPGNYPIISDPDPNLGSIGNITKEDFLRRELKSAIDECNKEWSVKSENGTVNGIPTINIRRFVHSNGTENKDLIGTSICKINQTSGLCRVPFDGYAFVIDNSYTAYRASGGWNNDPFDQNLAHELGHALGLIHRDAVGALMNTSQQEDGPKGTVSNIGLNSAEISTARRNAQEFQRMEARSFQENNIEENRTVLPYQDISSVKLTFDSKNNITRIDQELFGTIPSNIRHNNQSSIEYWTLIDEDNNTATGGNRTSLQDIGAPTSNFMGADLVIVGEIGGNDSQIGNGISGKSWVFNKQNQNMTLLPANMTRIGIERSALELHYRDETTRMPQLEGMPVFDTISTTIDNIKKMTTNESVESIVVHDGTIIDTINDHMLDNGE